MKKKVVWMGLILISCMSMVHGSPTVTGLTGLITVPTAEALHYKEVNLTYDYLIADDPENDTWYYKANLGTFRDWELGVVGGTSPEEGLYLNAKYYLMSDQTRYPVSFALGVENIASDDQIDVYLVASKVFQGGLSAHLGFKANFSQEVDPYIMGGAQYFLTNSISFLGDINGEKEVYSVNGGVQWFVTEDLSLRGIVLDVGNITPDGIKYGIGVSYAKFL